MFLSLPSLHPKNFYFLNAILRQYFSALSVQPERIIYWLWLLLEGFYGAFWESTESNFFLIIWFHLSEGLQSLPCFLRSTSRWLSFRLFFDNILAHHNEVRKDYEERYCLVYLNLGLFAENLRRKFLVFFTASILQVEFSKNCHWNNCFFRLILFWDFLEVDLANFIFLPLLCQCHRRKISFNERRLFIIKK